MAEINLTFGAFSAAECEALLRASDKVVTFAIPGKRTSHGAAVQADAVHAEPQQGPIEVCKPPEAPAERKAADAPVDVQPKGWSALFASSAPAKPIPSTSIAAAPPRRASIVDVLSGFKVAEHCRARAYRPRGLINTSNMCYMHAIMQTMVACTPLVNLLHELRAHADAARVIDAPLLRCMMDLVGEFRWEAARVGEDLCDQPFMPKALYDCVQATRGTALGQQEDAEEFLGFVLDRLHEELVATVRKLAPEPHAQQQGNDDEGWEEVGPRNQTARVQETAFTQSPVTAIFGGRIRSTVSTRGTKSASVTTQPFYSLQLDIQHPDVHSVVDALGHLTTSEAVDGFTCARTKQEVQAKKQYSIEALPPVLVLHLKRFVYDPTEGTVKLRKPISYAHTLEIKRELLSSKVRGNISNEQRQYQLFSAVYHHGKEAAGGHYTCDVRLGAGKWLRFDDEKVGPVSAGDVLRPDGPRDPYLLFYVQCSLAS